MSLQLAAKHLESQGRGDDTHLVHMTTGELAALQKLANKHGGSLSVNPHTGLPEAGFLSSILPTVAGVALGAVTGDPFMSAALVGGADAAMTGSLGQGLMAGLGAWSGASLSSAVGAMGDTTVAPTLESAGASTAGDIASTIAPQATNAAVDTTTGSSLLGNMGNVPTNTTMGGITGSGQAAQGLGAAGATTAQAPSMLGSLANAPIDTTGGGLTGYGVASPDQVAAPAQAAQAPTQAAPQTPVAGQTGLSAYLPQSMQDNLSKFSSGLGKVTNSWSDAKDFLMNNKMAALGTALPIGMAALTAMRQPIPTAVTSGNTNPMGLKINPQWTGPTVPAQPQPYYKATYPNYAANPYNPVTGAAGGGLMDINRYDGTDGSVTTSDTGLTPLQMYHASEDLKRGAEMMSTPKPEMSSYHTGFHTDPGTYTLSNTDYANTNPVALMKASHVKQAAGLAPTMTLGAINTDPAMLAQQQIAQQSQMPVTAKEGGLAFAMGGNVGYSMGGISSLGGYSDGGSLLKGPGDGVSDSIPASIGEKQPARLAEGEFVIPARIVSELGNGSTDAGAKRLYAMMDRVQNARKKTMAKGKFSEDTKAYKNLPV